MTRRLSWLLVVLLGGVFVGAVVSVFQQQVEAGKGLPDYSVYSEEANGLAEAARFLRRLGWEPVAVTRPIQHSRARGLLILVEPMEQSLFPGQPPEIPEADVKVLLRWVAQGNALLYCGRHHTAIHDALDVAVTTDTEPSPDEVFRLDPGAAGCYTEDVRRVGVEGRDTLDCSHGLPLWWQKDSPGALLLKHGRGHVLMVADPSLLTYRGLRREDNAVFVSNIARRHARDGKVYFDEYHHGLHSGGGFWSYLSYHGAHGVLVPLGLLLAAAAWALAVRLGPAVSRPAPLRADAVDYASAVARIYEKAGARRRLARALARGFLTALTRRLHLRRNALPAEVLRACQEQYPAAAAKRLQTLLRGAVELRKGDVTEQQLLEWSQAFDAFVASLGRPRGGA